MVVAKQSGECGSSGVDAPHGKPAHCAACPIRNKTICSVLTDGDLMALSTGSSICSLSSGRALFMEGESATAFFSLMEGVLRLTRLLPDGRRQILGFVFPGGHVGRAIPGVHSYTVEAVTDLKLCRLSVAHLQRVAETNPRLDMKLLEMTENELELAQDHIVLLGRNTAAEKLAQFLLSFGKQAAAGAPADAPVNVFLPMSREDIADYLGLTIETVSRGLSNLKRSGVISLPSPKSVRIESLSELARCASNPH